MPLLHLNLLTLDQVLPGSPRADTYMQTPVYSYTYNNKIGLDNKNLAKVSLLDVLKHALRTKHMKGDQR